MLGGLILIGLTAPALLAFDLFQDSLPDYLSLVEALGLSLSLSFIYFSSTLFYVVIFDSNAITSDNQRLYTALALSVLSYGIDLGYSYFAQLTLGDFVIALILLYVFFMTCFIMMRVRELSS